MSKWFWVPLMGTGLAIRSDYLSEQQAQTNHSQTLAKLADRGGLSSCEAAALKEQRAWREMDEAEALVSLAAHD